MSCLHHQSANPAPAVTTAPIVTFARAPQTISSQLIDYSTKSGLKTYNTGSATLTPDRFDINKDNVFTLLAALKPRSHLMNWTNIIMMIDVDSVPRNLLTHYALITTDISCQHVESYVFTATQKTQDNYLLYLCLRHSLTNQDGTDIEAWAEQYTSLNQHQMNK